MTQPGQLGVEELGATAPTDGDHPGVTGRSEGDEVVTDGLPVGAGARLELDRGIRKERLALRKLDLHVLQGDSFLGSCDALAVDLIGVVQGAQPRLR